MNHSRSNPFWREILNLRKNAPTLFRTVLFLVLLEISAIVLSPLLIPRSRCLSWYLSDKAKLETRRFLQGQSILLLDEYTGWRNRPDVKQQNWIIDSQGSRSTHAFTTQRIKPIRALFLGSSTINGGTRIRNDQTISAFLEDGDIEALNFGTMMYSLDQCLLAYQHRLYAFNANVIIVGLDADPVSGLKNHYIPLHFPDEENMPYLKPRFELASNSLRLVTVRPEVALSTFPQCSDLLDFLSKNDSFYFRFETYRRMGLLPLSGGLRFLYLRTLSFMTNFRYDSQDERLLTELMTEMVNEARKRDAEVIFLMVPEMTTFAMSGVHHFLPDNYARRYDELRSAGYNVVDIRQIFRDSGRTAYELFDPDEVHLTPLSNQMVAEALRPVIRAVAKGSDRRGK